MYELTQAIGNSYYIDCPARMGLYRLDEKNVCLIDSGGDKDAAKKVEKILNAQGWTLQSIISTHYHADHIGGNQRLQQTTGCRVYACGIEGALTEYPVLEPALLYGGYPPKDLRHKFLMAQPSKVLDLSDASFPASLQPVPLPGHSFNMVGIRTPDNVVYLADSVSSAETLKKYRVCVIYDVAQYLETLDSLDQLKADLFVPAHAPVVADIHELAALNREAVWQVADDLLSFLASPMQFEDILQCLFEQYGLAMNFEQYVLVGSTVKSYLSWFKDTGKADVSFECGRMLWHAVNGQ